MGWSGSASVCWNTVAVHRERAPSPVPSTLDDHVGDDVLRARRAVGIQPGLIAERPHLRGALVARDVSSVGVLDAIRRVLEHGRQVGEPAGIEVFGVRHEERVDRMPIRERGRADHRQVVS